MNSTAFFFPMLPFNSKTNSHPSPLSFNWYVVTAQVDQRQDHPMELFLSDVRMYAYFLYIVPRNKLPNLQPKLQSSNRPNSLLGLKTYVNA